MLPRCPGCYRDVKDQTVTAQFTVKHDDNKVVQELLSKVDKGWDDIEIIAWTTTPWTLPSNTALCVGPKIDYVALESFNPYSGRPATYLMSWPRPVSMPISSPRARTSR